MALTAVIIDMWSDTKRLHVCGTITAAGNYATGGMTFNPITALTDSRPGFPSAPIASNKTVVHAVIEGIAGFKYEFVKATNKIIIRSVAAVTPVGTISAPVFTGGAASLTATSSKPTFTVTKGAILGSSELGLSADAATATVNNNTIAATLELTPNGPVGTPTITCGAYTPVGTNSAPTFTGTAQAAAALAQLAVAALPAGVTGDTISCYFIFK